ncbi:MAG: secretin N-terminal domain-containing protein [Candidatus Omnitrophota bacterium]
MKKSSRFKIFIAWMLCLSFALCFSIKTMAEESLETEEERISLELKNVEIIELLRILSMKTGKTIVPSGQISGRITVFLNSINFKDILDIITLTHGLAVEKKKDIYYIMTAAEYKALFGKNYFDPRRVQTIRLTYATPSNVFNALSQIKSEIGSVIVDESTGTVILIDIPEKLKVLEEAIKELDQPLQTVVFDLNYAKAEDAQTQLSAAVTEGTGEVIVDERSSKAIITDLPAKMQKIRGIVRELDEETRQVYIEADIVEVSLTDNFSRGINWEKLFAESVTDSLDLVGNFTYGLSTYQRIQMGTMERDHFSAVMDFLENYGDTKIISQPRLAVVNNQEAYVLVGVRDAYITGTSSQAEATTIVSESVEFLDVGIKLTVTPTISKDGFITMKVKPEISSAGDPLETTAGSRIPIVTTSEAETTVKIKDGTMLMIAGLAKETKSEDIDGIPFLSKIPIIGSIFSSRAKVAEKSEIIVFITPRLMRGDVVLAGTEPEKHIPEDIMPDDMKDKFIKDKKMSRALNELSIFPPEPAKVEPESELTVEQTKIKEGADEKKPYLLQTAQTPEQIIKPGEETRVIEEAKMPGKVIKPGEEMQDISTSQPTEKITSLVQEAKEAEGIQKPEEVTKLAKLPQIQEVKVPEGLKGKEEIARLEEIKEVEKVEVPGKLGKPETKSIGKVKRPGAPEKIEGTERPALTEVPKKELKKTKDQERITDYYRKAIEYQNLNMWDEAIDYYEKVILLDSAFVPAYNQLGVLYESKGLTGKAERMYLKAVQLNPDYAPAYSNLALLNEAKNNIDNAIRYWRKRALLGGSDDPWTFEALRHIEELKEK